MPARTSDCSMPDVSTRYVSCVAVLDGEAPMSVPCLYDTAEHKPLIDAYLTPERCPAPQFRAAERVPSGVFDALSQQSRPCIGVPDTLPTWPANMFSLADALRRGAGVPMTLIAHGQRSVPRQNESWTCGVNSSARFAAMLGQKIPDYALFMRGAPRYGGRGLAPTVGANAGGLERHLRAQNCLRGTAIGGFSARDIAPIWTLIDRAMDLGRPIMVLFVRSGLNMHWVTLVAHHRQSGNFFYMDTDGSVSEIIGGRDELMRRMNADNCLAQKLGFIERYNTVSATQALCPKNFSAYMFDPTYYWMTNHDLRATYGRLGGEARLEALRRHYDEDGLKEGRRGHPAVCFATYLERYPELKAEFGSDKVKAARHYYEHGQRENRSACP